jgi:DNA polymerase III subunit gamma/tau
VIEKVFHAGYDPKIFAQDLLEEIRHALMIRLCTEDATRVVDLPDAEITALREASAPLSNEDLHMLFDMALKGVNDLLRSQDARLVLEMLLLRMTHAPRVLALSQLLQGHLPTLNTSATQVAPQAAHSTSPQTRATPPTSATPKPAASAEVDRPPSAPIEEKPKYNFVRPASPEAAARMAAQAQANAEAAAYAEANPTPTQTPLNASLAKEEYEEIAEENKALRNDPWFQFVTRVKKSNAMLGAMLENTFLMSQTDSELVLGVPKKVSFLFDKVADKENLKKVETFLETFWNKKYTVTAKLADEKAVKAAEVEAPTPKAVIEKVQKAKQKTVENQVETNALVRSVQDVFKGQIKSIKEKR